MPPRERGGAGAARRGLRDARPSLLPEDRDQRACAPDARQRQYNRIFRQPRGVRPASSGEAAVDAMYEHRSSIDVSHMRAEALDDTFDAARPPRPEQAPNPRGLPGNRVACRVPVREQPYMLDPPRSRRSPPRRRGGPDPRPGINSRTGAPMARASTHGRNDPGARRQDPRGHRVQRHMWDRLRPRRLHQADDGGSSGRGLARARAWVRTEYPSDADAICTQRASGSSGCSLSSCARREGLEVGDEVPGPHFGVSPCLLVAARTARRPYPGLIFASISVFACGPMFPPLPGLTRGGSLRSGASSTLETPCLLVATSWALRRRVCLHPASNSGYCSKTSDNSLLQKVPYALSKISLFAVVS